MLNHFLAPPDISVEKTWIHAADGCEVELVCTLLGDLSSDVSTCVLNIKSLTQLYDDYDYFIDYVVPKLFPSGHD